MHRKLIKMIVLVDSEKYENTSPKFTRYKGSIYVCFSVFNFCTQIYTISYDI